MLTAASRWFVLELLAVTWAADSTFHQVGQSSSDALQSIKVGSNGNYYLCGYTRSSWPGFTATGSIDYLFAVLDSSGTLVAHEQIGGGACVALATDSTDNVYTVGYEGNDGMLVKYNSAGVRQWMISPDGLNGGGNCRGVSLDLSGDVIIAGSTGGTFAGFSSAGGMDVFVQKYNTDGIVQWTLQTGSTGLDDVWDMALDSSGNAIIVGQNYGPWAGQTFPAGCPSSGTSCVTGFALKVDNAGNLLWVFPITPTATMTINCDDRAVAVVLDEIFVSGRLRANHADGSFNGQTLSAFTNHYFLMKLSASGSLEWFTFTAPLDTLTWAAAAQQLLGGNFVGNQMTLKSLSTTDGSELWSEQSGVDSTIADVNAIVASGEIFYVGGYTTSGTAAPGHTSQGREDLLVWKLDTRTSTTTATATTATRTVSTSSTMTGTTSTSSTATRTTTVSSSITATATSTLTSSSTTSSSSATSTSSTTLSSSTSASRTSSTTGTSKTTSTTVSSSTTTSSTTSASTSSSSSSTSTSITSTSTSSATSTSSGTSTSSTSTTTSTTSSTSSSSSSGTLTTTSWTATSTASTSTSTTTLLASYVMPLHVEPASALGSLARDLLTEAVNAVVDGVSSSNANTTSGKVWLTKLGPGRTQVQNSDGAGGNSEPTAVSVPPALVAEFPANASVWLSVVQVANSIIADVPALSAEGPVTLASQAVEVSLLQEIHGHVSVLEISGSLNPIAIRLADDERPGQQQCYWFDPVAQMWSRDGTEIPDYWQLRALDVRPLDGTWCLTSHLTLFALAVPPPPLPETDYTVAIASGSGVACLGALAAAAFGRQRHRSAKRRKREAEQSQLESWYPHHRHTIFSVMQNAMDEGARGLVLLKVAADLPNASTEISWRDLNTDLRTAHVDRKRPFYDGDKPLFHFRDIAFKDCSRSSRLGEELRYHTSKGHFVIVASCTDDEVKRVKSAIRSHNMNRDPEQGLAKFAWSSPEVFAASTARGSQIRKKKSSRVLDDCDVRTLHWYSHYKFTVYGAVQTAVDEGAAGVQLLGVMPGENNVMTYNEFPTLQEDWKHAAQARVFPFIDIGGEQLLRQKPCSFQRVAKSALWEDLDFYTKDNMHAVIVSCTDDDELEVVDLIKRFNQQRPDGHGKAKRAWSTSSDMYADRVRHSCTQEDELRTSPS